MIADPKDHFHVPHEREWALQLVALIVALIIVASGMFILYSASKEYRTPGIKAAPMLNGVPVTNPAAAPAVGPAL